MKIKFDACAEELSNLPSRGRLVFSRNCSLFLFRQRELYRERLYGALLRAKIFITLIHFYRGTYGYDKSFRLKNCQFLVYLFKTF